MQRLAHVAFEEHRQLATVAYRPRFLGEVVQNDTRVISAAEKGPVDAHRSPLDQRRRCPDQDNSKYCAQSHSDIRIRADESREDVSEEPDGGSRNDEHQNDKAPLHQNVPRTASQQHRNFHHAVLHHRISEGEGIQEQHERQHGIDPEGGAISSEIHGRAFEHDRHDAGHGPPQNYS